jgi:diguanylate cyclase (GGDEF)-like protein
VPPRPTGSGHRDGRPAGFGPIKDVVAPADNTYVRPSPEYEIAAPEPSARTSLGVWAVAPLLVSLAIGAPVVLNLDVGVVTAWTIQAALSLVTVAGGVLAFERFSPQAGDPSEVARRTLDDARTSDANQRAFDAQFDRALDMLDREPAVLDMTRTALERVDPTFDYELHLVDPSKPELCLAMSTVDPPASDRRAKPWSPWESMAARQAKTIVYDTTERLDVCPHLKSRIDEPCSAVCVPLIVMGRILGVLYAVSDSGPPSGELVERIEAVARRSALHIGLIRATSKPEPEVALDDVTGLPEQKAARERLVQLTDEGTPYSLAIVDVDHFAIYRERHGEEAANEALQLLAESLVHAVRPTDLVARVGDHEFAVVLPNSTAQSALKAIERVREQLIIIQAMRPKPLFTCSFGLSHSSMSQSVDGIIALAATALETAQAEGRNRVVIAGAARTYGHPAGQADLS